MPNWFQITLNQFGLPCKHSDGQEVANNSYRPQVKQGLLSCQLENGLKTLPWWYRRTLYPSVTVTLKAVKIHMYFVCMYVRTHIPVATMSSLGCFFPAIRAASFSRTACWASSSAEPWAYICMYIRAYVRMYVCICTIRSCSTFTMLRSGQHGSCKCITLSWLCPPNQYSHTYATCVHAYMCHINTPLHGSFINHTVYTAEE